MVRRLKVGEEPTGSRFSNVVPHRAGRRVNCTWLCCNNSVGIPWTLSLVLLLPDVYPHRRYAFLTAWYYPVSTYLAAWVGCAGMGTRHVQWYLGADPRRWGPHHSSLQTSVA